VTAGMAIAFLIIGDPVWLIAAANLTYLIGIALPSVAVWLLRHNEPEMARPYRAPRGMVILGLFAAATWALTAVLGFQQFGMPPSKFPRPPTSWCAVPLRISPGRCRRWPQAISLPPRRTSI